MAALVHEITIVAPNLICVEVRDEEHADGHYQDYGSAQSGTFDAFGTYSDASQGGAGNTGYLITPDKKHVKFHTPRDRSQFLDRVAAKVAGNYSITGGANPTVTDVRYLNLPHTHSWWDSFSGAAAPSVTFAHFLFLKLSANLTQGVAYTIDFPAGTGLANEVFTWTDLTTRCLSIQTSDIGHRPSDEWKAATWCQWVPGEPNEGQVDPIDDLGITTFDIINQSGTVVYTGSVVLALAATASEYLLNGYPNSSPPDGTHLMRYASMTQTPLTVTGVVNTGSPSRAQVTSNGHGLSEGQIIATGILPHTSIGAMTGSNLLCRAKNVTANTFDLYYYGSFLVGSGTDDTPITINATWSSTSLEGPSVNKIYKTHVANFANSHVYRFDFSAWTPSADGLYRVRLPGLGVSRAFLVNDTVYHSLAAVTAQGEYHQRHGAKIDGRFGFTSDWRLRHGKNGCVIYKSMLPSEWTDQGGVGTGFVIPCHAAANPGWRTATTVDAGGEWMDAGDWDVFPIGHLSTAHHLMNVLDSLSEGSSLTDFNLPKNSDANFDLGAEYSEMDGCPELLHQAVWGVAWLKRCQEVNGAVPGGLQGSRQYSIGEEPSQHAYAQWVTNLPTHTINFMYAGAAARAGRLLKEFGATTLGQEFIDSAELAYQWAEDIYQHISKGTSATSLSVGSGSKTFSHDGYPFRGTRALGITVGQRWRARSRANIANFMEGDVTATVQTEATSTVTLNVNSTGGSGTHADWDLIQVSPVPFDNDYYYASETGIMDSITFTANSTLGSPTLTSVSSTAGLTVGMQVIGLGMDGGTSFGRVIDSINVGASTVTMRDMYDAAGNDGDFYEVNQNGNPNATSSNTGATYTASRPGGGISQATYDGIVHHISWHDFARDGRCQALGCLARATEDAAYAPLFDDCYFGTNRQGFAQFGAYDYYHAAVATPSVKDSIVSTFNGFPGVAMIQVNNSEELANPFRIAPPSFNPGIASAPFTYNVTHYGNDAGGGMSSALLWAHDLDTDETRKARYRKTMQAMLACSHGVNPQGFSYTRGFGARDAMNFCVDAYVLDAGSTPGGMPGVTCYGPTFTLLNSHQIDGFNYCNNGSHQSAINDAYNPTNAATNFDDVRVVEPTRMSRPIWWVSNIRYDINAHEYGMPTVSLQEMYAMYLHGWDGNVLDTGTRTWQLTHN